MKLNEYIDHTLLKPEATEQDIVQLCEEAIKYQFASVCVNPIWVKLCAKLLSNTDIKVASVIGFPLGAMIPEIKAVEAGLVAAKGATEVDMVMNIGWLKSKKIDDVLEDIEAVVKVVKRKAIVKVILETGLLSKEEIELACSLSVRAGAQFVKTSTGFGPGGATVDQIQLMRKTVGPTVGVKASGGVRDYETAMAMIQAGATRIGTSSGVLIMEGKREEGTGY